MSRQTNIVETNNLAGEQLRARIAWYYFVAGLTQQEISDRLGIARARVNKIAGQLRADGSVIIDIRLPLAACVELEERLKTAYGLKSAAVVPALDDDEQQRRMLGEAAASILDELIADGQGISIGWGRTLSIMIKQLRSRRLRDSSVVSLMGGLTRGSETNTFGVSTELARTLGADCYYITAPVYCSCVESREFLLRHGGVNEVMERARRSDLSIVSCGDLTPRTPLTTIGSVRERLPQLRKCGAIGEILGTFLDADGVPVVHELNDTVIAMPPADLKKVPDSLLISGGLYKADIVRAILVSGYVNRLVTDEAVARRLLERA
ncbi:MAG: sugar-binding transcriptional regulator [Candidatus Accumulibacter sp.]|jgi:DNA-binding transcriptional regulator LsrR (DeoR family)|nr:sugar-binding transcriptional regulator [Accumulibacter sp.]